MRTDKECAYLMTVFKWFYTAMQAFAEDVEGYRGMKGVVEGGSDQRGNFNSRPADKRLYIDSISGMLFSSRECQWILMAFPWRWQASLT
jgi:hypothetical protein